MARVARKPATRAQKSALSITKKKQLSSATTSTSTALAASVLLSKDVNEYLHQDKDSKKQKRDLKRTSFLTKIGASDNSSSSSNGISKSNNGSSNSSSNRKSHVPVAIDSYKFTTITDFNSSSSQQPGPTTTAAATVGSVRRSKTTTIHDLPGLVSKSAIRRRKRNAKAAVLSSVADLSSALPDLSESTTSNNSSKESKTTKSNINTNTNTNTNTETYKSSTRNVATDRPPTARMTERVVKHEMAKFSQTLNNAEFKASPFAALRASINATIVKKSEFVVADTKKRDVMEM